MKKKCVAMLLAGGQGSRLYALTRNVAKPNMPFGGKYRIIDFPLSNCANSGIDTVGVLTQYRPLQLNAYVGNGAAWDLDSNGGGVYILVFRLLTELSEFLRQIGENPAFLSEAFGAVRRILSTFGENGEALLTALLNYLGEALLSFLPRVLLALFTALPRFLFAVVIGIVASVYFSLDLDRINQGVRSFLPPRAFALLLKLKGGVLKTVWGYARAYSIIFLLVLTTLLLGFCFLRIPYALLLSFTVALLDILPVIGVGTVLIPYSIYAFAVGNTWRGVGLLVLYAIIFVGRQWAEPHIIGRRFGIHPVLSLIFLYLGTKLFGFTGLLLAPLFAVAFKSLFTKEKDIEKEAPASG